MRYVAGSRRSGLTLLELLIVMAIILLVSVATIPVALGVFGEQEVSGAASTVHAMFSLTRDTAVRNGRPVGIRLIPDPDLAGSISGGDYRMASNRMLELQVPPDYTQGRAGKLTGHGLPELDGITWQLVAHPTIPTMGNTFLVRRIAVVESKLEGESSFALPAPPLVPTDLTSWYGNIRQGERIRFDTTRQDYIVAGPFFRNVPQSGPPARADYLNSERFVYGPTCSFSTAPVLAWIPSLPFPASAPANRREILFVVNGRDDDGDGYVDEEFDGIDNNNDGLIDPGYNGVDDDGDGLIDEMDELLFNRVGGVANYNPFFAEYEEEVFIGAPVDGVQYASSYAITRRPIPSPDSREVQLPGNTVIDLTTSVFPLIGAGPSERSVVPIDPLSGYVEFIIYPNGRVAPSSYAGNYTYLADFPAYYLWIAEREDVRDVLWGVDTNNYPNPNPAAGNSDPNLRFFYRLPMTKDTKYYLDHDKDGVIDTAPPIVAQQAGNFLEGGRRIVAISSSNGKASVSSFTIDDAQQIGAVFNQANRQQTGQGN